MSDDTPELQPAEPAAQPGPEMGRRALMLGAVGASAVLSIRPALAQTAASISNCQIPVPDPARAGQYVAADGKLVPAGTQGAFPPAGRPFTGEEVKRALRGGTLPGADYQRSRAYTNYIRRLQQGTSGFTCFASLQMPRA
ncbi:hypothetical protein [Sphingomonas sp. Y38-1Y]|jgi:hypothetical protein|uniref:hypothetical protein n=1 Tax=Sphingomonas sp. Y38-1Y TaxID=3078265 RepID=UPI0039648B27